MYLPAVRGPYLELLTLASQDNCRRSNSADKGFDDEYASSLVSWIYAIYSPTRIARGLFDTWTVDMIKPLLSFITRIIWNIGCVMDPKFRQ